MHPLWFRRPGACVAARAPVPTRGQGCVLLGWSERGQKPQVLPRPPYKSVSPCHAACKSHLSLQQVISAVPQPEDRQTKPICYPRVDLMGQVLMQIFRICRYLRILVMFFCLFLLTSYWLWCLSRWLPFRFVPLPLRGQFLLQN